MITGSNSLSTMPKLVLLFLSNVMYMVEILSLYNWSTANSTLPRANSDMVVGAWKDAIFLVGGNPNENQLLKYDTLNNEFIDYGEYYIEQEHIQHVQLLIMWFIHLVATVVHVV